MCLVFPQVCALEQSQEQDLFINSGPQVPNLSQIEPELPLPRLD